MREVKKAPLRKPSNTKANRVVIENALLKEITHRDKSAPALEHIAENLIRESLKSNMKAIQLLFDYVIGKPDNQKSILQGSFDKIIVNVKK